MWEVFKGLMRELKIRKIDQQIIGITNKRAKLREKQAKLTKQYEQLVKGTK